MRGARGEVLLGLGAAEGRRRGGPRTRHGRTASWRSRVYSSSMATDERAVKGDGLVKGVGAAGRGRRRPPATAVGRAYASACGGSAGVRWTGGETYLVVAVGPALRLLLHTEVGGRGLFFGGGGDGIGVVDAGVAGELVGAGKTASRRRGRCRRTAFRRCGCGCGGSGTVSKRGTGRAGDIPGARGGENARPQRWYGHL